MGQGPLVLEADWEGYSLVDCGSRRKLERFGDRLLIRGEPKAWWSEQAGLEEWHRAEAEISDVGGKWKISKSRSRDWQVTYQDLTLEARLTDMSKHVGIFPEQEPHWRWLREKLPGRSSPKVLNLFGYTGVATLIAAASGAQVTHVDASKPSINWARHNQKLSGLEKAPVRWLLDDAFKFVAREVRRENHYDAILLDPPSFGRGPKGELWKVEQQLPELLGNLQKILSPARGSIVVLTLYNLEASSLMLKNLMDEFFPGGDLEFGELVLPCRDSDRRLPLSIFARWQA